MAGEPSRGAIMKEWVRGNWQWAVAVLISLLGWSSKYWGTVALTRWWWVIVLVGGAWLLVLLVGRGVTVVRNAMAKWQAYLRSTAVVKCSGPGSENVDYILWARTEKDDRDSRCQPLGTVQAGFRELSVEVLVPNCMGRHRYWPHVLGRLNLHAPPEEQTPFASLQVGSGGVCVAFSEGQELGATDPANINTWHTLRVSRDSPRRTWCLFVDRRKIGELEAPPARDVHITLSLWYSKPPPLLKGLPEAHDGMIAQAWFRSFEVR